MNVQLKNLPLNEELIQAVCRWENDPAISPFITPHYVETSELPSVTEGNVRESLSDPDKRNYFICVDDKPIGIASIIRDFPALLRMTGKQLGWESISANRIGATKASAKRSWLCMKRNAGVSAIGASNWGCFPTMPAQSGCMKDPASHK